MTFDELKEEIGRGRQVANNVLTKHGLSTNDPDIVKHTIGAVMSLRRLTILLCNKKPVKGVNHHNRMDILEKVLDLLFQESILPGENHAKTASLVSKMAGTLTEQDLLALLKHVMPN